MSFHQKGEGVRVAAVCDLNEERLALGVEATGNPGVATYRDYRKLLENPDIDAVIVATNDHWHVLPTVHACQAGKDVYLEKPVGTSIAEGRAAVVAARKYNRIVQFGSQQRSWKHYREAAEIVQSGALGEISEVKAWDYNNFYPGFGAPADADPPAEFGEKYWDFWVGPSPQAAYNPNRFLRHYWFFDYGGGWPLDWGVHHYDIVHWFMQVLAPSTVTAIGGFRSFEETNTEWPDTLSAICEYEPGPMARKGFILQYTFRGGCAQAPTILPLLCLDAPRRGSSPGRRCSDGAVAVLHGPWTLVPGRRLEPLVLGHLEHSQLAAPAGPPTVLPTCSTGYWPTRCCGWSFDPAGRRPACS